MEFVEGETLEKLIKRSGRVKVKLALEIATQVAGGLAAVHKQKLVHRDIKPSNIMVSLEEGGAVTAKIIDLGLAKSLDEPGAQTAISTAGAFAGTPEFASPEQFAGRRVAINVVCHEDIRGSREHLGMVYAEAVGEPARELKIDQAVKALAPRCIGSLLELRCRIRAVPCRRVDEAERRRALGKLRRKRLRHVATHRTAGNDYLRPADVIEQLRKVAREHVRGVRSGRSR